MPNLRRQEREWHARPDAQVEPEHHDRGRDRDLGSVGDGGQGQDRHPGPRSIPVYRREVYVAIQREREEETGIERGGVRARQDEPISEVCRRPRSGAERQRPILLRNPVFGAGPRCSESIREPLAHVWRRRIVADASSLPRSGHRHSRQWPRHFALWRRSPALFENQIQGAEHHDRDDHGGREQCRRKHDEARRALADDCARSGASRCGARPCGAAARGDRGRAPPLRRTRARAG
jgi:hypothetical protein